MHAHSRFAASSSVSADEHEALIRELTRGHELTARLWAEAPRALRGQGQAEDTAAFILQEVSRAFTVCISIMRSPPPSGAPPPPPPTEAATRRFRDENAPRREVVTYAPDSDGYLWRKYGQKRITNKDFPRSYFRCSHHRERGCPAMKQVQRHSHDEPPQYVVVYVHEHTCDTTVWEPEVTPSPAPAGATTSPLPLLADHLPGLASQQRGVAQAEQERQAMVSTLAVVLGAHSPAGSGSRVAAFEREPQQQQHGASASVVDPSVVGGGGELPRLDVDAELDVMDYDVTGAMYLGDSYGLPDDGLQF